MINKEELAREARNLVKMLKYYEKEYPAAGELLRRKQELFSSAIEGRISTPLREGFFPEELWMDGELFELTELCDCAARFSILLQGWRSIEEFRIHLQSEDNKYEEDEFLSNLIERS